MTPSLAGACTIACPRAPCLPRFAARLVEAIPVVNEPCVVSLLRALPGLTPENVVWLRVSPRRSGRLLPYPTACHEGLTVCRLHARSLARLSGCYADLACPRLGLAAHAARSAAARQRHPCVCHHRSQNVRCLRRHRVRLRATGCQLLHQAPTAWRQRPRPRAEPHRERPRSRRREQGQALQELP